MSRKPSVATKSTRPMRPVRTAFVAMVVPWESSRTSAGTNASTASSVDASARPIDGSSGVEGTFATRRLPSLPIATASVNVPPTSTATTQDSLSWDPQTQTVEDSYPEQPPRRKSSWSEHPARSKHNLDPPYSLADLCERG